MSTVIVLNSDGQYLNSISWQDALTLLYKGVAKVVKESKQIVRTINKEYIVPAVIILIKQVRALFGKRVPWSRVNLFTRDNYTCQYCGAKVNHRTAQIEHVIPRSRNGKTGYDNCVTACKDCNQKKGDKTPQEAKMYLKKQPYQPTINEFLQQKMLQLKIWESLEE